MRGTAVGRGSGLVVVYDARMARLLGARRGELARVEGGELRGLRLARPRVLEARVEQRPHHLG